MSTKIKTLDERIDASDKMTLTIADQLVMAIEEADELRSALAEAEHKAWCAEVNEDGARERLGEVLKAQAPSAPVAVCDGCHGNGMQHAGYSGQESDGNVQISEPCSECGYGDSTPVAPIDERAEFQKAMNAARFFPRELDFSMTKSPGGKRDEYVNTHLESCWNGWQARAALSLKVETAPSADPVVEMNVALLRARSAVGVKKYGVTMADSKLPLRAWLVHALEESLDHANYLQRAMLEIDQVGPRARETPP